MGEDDESTSCACFRKYRRGARMPPDPITANHQSNSFSVPPLPQNCPCPLVCTTSNGDTIELDYEMLCLADPGRGSKGAANVACPMAWAESCAVKECKDRKWGPHSQRAQQASRPPDLDRWTSVRASFPLPHGHARERTTAEASEACRYRGRRGQSQRERPPLPCHALALEWTWSGH